MAQIANRITVDPQQCGGRPCVRGMRIRVVDVLELLASGLLPDQVVGELPDLEPADITACLRFASQRLDAQPPARTKVNEDLHLLLSTQRALLTQVTPELRGVSADIDLAGPIIHLRFVFARQPSDSERDAASSTAAEVIADFPFRESCQLIEEYLVVPLGERIPNLRLLAYLRCEDEWVGPTI